MKNNKNGITLVALVITIIILMILAGVSIVYVIGDNGVIANTMKMEVDTAKGEVRDHMLLLLNEELLSASAEIVGTTADIGTVYNEPRLVNFLQGNKNYADTDYEDSAAIKCIEAFTDKSANGVSSIASKSGTENIDSKYRVISEVVCPDGDKYGIGQNISDGNIFVLEAITAPSYEGKFELVYYDKDHNREVLETVSLYVTNQS